MAVTITLHPVVTWAWIVVVIVGAIGLLLGLIEAVMWDRLPGWVEVGLCLVMPLFAFAFTIAAILTGTSLIF